jgi:complex iron-sulfur molybdoenzyme family reductase subunit gamma
MSARWSSALVLVSSLASANEAFFTRDVVEAEQVQALPTEPSDAAWARAKKATFFLVPQRTVRLHDKQVNELLRTPAPIELSVKAVVSKTALSLLLEWSDASMDVVRDDELNTYADSAAVQVPVTFGKGVRLPAISMGDEEQPVRLWLTRATKSGALVSELRAAGFGSSTRQAPSAPKPGVMNYDAATKQWRVVAQVPLDGAPALIPVAFALWDGQRLERSGNKRLSSWRFVRVAGRAVDAEYVKEVSWGIGPGALGDPLKGKVLAEAVCAACHHLPGRETAAEGLAPSLFDVGAISLPVYLRESITHPSAVVMHGPNPNQHQDRSQPPDRFRAYPNSEALRWFTVGPDGKRVSKMPPMGFAPEQLSELVAFLMTLDGKRSPP